MKKIYKTYLIKGGACETQVKLFNKHYPRGIYVCADCFEDAQNLGLDVWWLKNFLYLDAPDFCAKFIMEHCSFYRRRIISKEGLQLLACKLLDTPRPRKK